MVHTGWSQADWLGAGSRAGLLSIAQAREGTLLMVLQTGMAGGAFKQGREMLLTGFSFKQQFTLGETLLQSGVMCKAVAICVISASTVGDFASHRVH